MRDNFKMTNIKDKAFTTGQTAIDMSDSGKMTNSTEKALNTSQMVLKNNKTT